MLALCDLTKIYLVPDVLGMENIEYGEWVPAGALVKGLFTMVSLIVVVVTFAVSIFSKEMLVEDILGVLVAWVILASCLWYSIITEAFA